MVTCYPNDISVAAAQMQLFQQPFLTGGCSPHLLGAAAALDPLTAPSTSSAPPSLSLGAHLP